MRSAELFYGVMLLSFVYSILKFRKSVFYIFIILLFYDGMFAYAGVEIWNIYKILLPLFAFYCFIKHGVPFRISGIEKLIILSFLLFSISFLFSSYLNGDYFNITFSQYSKYLNLLLTFFILKKIEVNSDSFEKVERLIFSLLIIQIILTVIKFYVWGLRESVVGSINFTGGATATVLPVLGFIFIWLKRRGNLKNKDWLFVILLMFIGFVSLKRAVWFIMPVVIFLFSFYVSKRVIPKIFLLAIPLIPLIFYFGVRLNPTLNKEGKTWGSYDLDFVINYTKDYTFGIEKGRQKKGYGRGGATILLVDNLVNKNLDNNALFGYGLTKMYTTDYEQFNDLNLGISMKGSAAGIFQSYVTDGYIGLFSTLLFSISLLMYVKDRRMRIALMIIFFWEYLFYTGIILRSQALSFLFIYIIVFSDQYINKASQNAELSQIILEEKGS